VCDHQETARYFLPKNDSLDARLTVAGDNTPEKITRNIRAEWIGLQSNFQGSFTIAPKQVQYGFLLRYNQDLGDMLKIAPLQDFWFEVELPIVVIHNRFNLQEDVAADSFSTTYPHDIKQAFNQKLWDYAKIPPCSNRVALAEFILRLGSDFLNRDHFIVSYYGFLTIPGSSKQRPVHIFEAVAGNNGHVGFGGAVSFQLAFNKEPANTIGLFFLDMQETFLVRNKQYRTFDLKGKQWSKYLLLVNKDGPEGDYIPAVNVLTLPVHARQFGVTEVSMGFRFLIHKKFEFEVGYSIWGHSRERLELLCVFPSDRWGIAGNPAGVVASDLFPGTHVVTASQSDIQHQATNDIAQPWFAQVNRYPEEPFVGIDRSDNPPFIFVPIREADIDLRSAAAQAALNDQFHLALGVKDLKTGPLSWYVGVGGFFDFPKKNAALKLQGGWLKVGTSF
jgi:hypothetical protein